jgi:hypothetical protein
MLEAFDIQKDFQNESQNNLCIDNIKKNLIKELNL